MQKITTFLTFDNQAEEAVNLYCSIFPKSRIVSVSRYGEAGPGPAGSVMTAEFVLDGQPFIAMNGGPHFTLSDGISLYVSCETQEEVDAYWDKLSEGGGEVACGWVKDKFGVSWQIIPTALNRLLSDPNRAKAQNVMKAMLQMKKIVIADLQRAYEEG